MDREPTVDHTRIECVSCKSTSLERVCESRKPLAMKNYKVRWYRRLCRDCGQKFVTREKDYS